ncbi:MAG: tRNA (adenosine(37)-N6)-threonylcarbamoyltransferase complex dimerization subunit type 1 TsaB [Syntrophobacteraceae bacterium]
MKILAVDTSTPSGSVAVLDGLRVPVEWSLQSARTHNRRLLGTVDDLLRELGWTLADMDVYAVTVGPGSFTGLRIGLTTMKTLAWSMGKPLVGVPSLDALAAPLEFACLPVCCLIDAAKREIYSAQFSPGGEGGLRRTGPYRVSEPERIVELVCEPTLFCGDGWLSYRDYFLERLGNLAVEPPAPFHLIRAGFVGELARRRFLAGESDDPMSCVPMYIRPSEAELNGSRSS